MEHDVVLQSLFGFCDYRTHVFLFFCLTWTRVFTVGKEEKRIFDGINALQDLDF